MGDSFAFCTEEVYNAVIDATIEKCSSTQSPRVLEALKNRWKEALTNRLQRANNWERNPTARFVSARNLTLNTGSVPVPDREAASPAEKYDSNISGYSKQAESTTEMAGSQDISNDFGILTASSVDPGQVEDEDEEFLDAAVDISGGPVATEEENTITVEEPLGLTSAAEQDIPRSSDLDDSDLSDLDDVEPEARDMIIAQFDKVSRPSGKKTVSSSHWKILLRNGVMQLNGQEILFDKMSGEFAFR